MAVVEFALILPLMLMVYLGMVEVSRGMRASQKLSLVAHTLSDLAAQMLPGQSTILTSPCTSTGQACMSEADITAIFAAAATILGPLPTNNIKMTISEVKIEGVPNNTTPTSWTATTQWSVTRNGATKRPCGQLTPLDAQPVSSATIQPNWVTVVNGVSPKVPNSIIIADVVYNYSPGINFEMMKWNAAPNWTMQRTSYAQVRNTYVPNHILYYMTSGTNCNGAP